jgi:bifunctional non-homologous end joining protein LigD
LKLNLTNLDKIYFPKAKISKGDLVDYYRRVADFILPYIKNRPHSLLRHPNGIGGESFFQKDLEDHPTWVKTESIYSESNQKQVHYLVCKDLDHLLYMVQLGCIEINPWNSRVGRLDKPDWIVLDLDPEDIGFDKVIEAALIVKQVCDELKIPTYPKTSGKTGIHIYVPVGAKYTYEQCKQLSQILANLVHERTPDFTSVERLPKKRQKKVYVDFLQNRQGQTLAAPYSVRPTPQATVSTPLHWDEVKKGLDSQKFTIKTIQKRLSKVGDLWKPVLQKGINIPKTLKLLD